MHLATRLNQVLTRAEDEQKSLKDDFLSVEHVLPKALVPATETAAVEALDAIDGVKVADTAKGVSVRFSPQALPPASLRRPD